LVTSSRVGVAPDNTGQANMNNTVASGTSLRTSILLLQSNMYIYNDNMQLLP
jgi:hypothetical protein